MIAENEKLLIRELTEDDISMLFHLYSDKETMKFRGSKPLENPEEAVGMLKSVMENIKNETEFRYGIIEKSSNELIGTFLITPVSEKICKIGCSLGSKYQRKGYGSETITIMTTRLNMSGYKKIIGLIKKENIPSIKLVEKLNFTLLQQTEYPDLYQYEKDI